MASRTRRFLIIVLITLTVVLGGVAVYIGYTLQKGSESTAPTETQAGENCAPQPENNSTSFTFDQACSSPSIKVYRKDYSGSVAAYYPNCITDDEDGTLVSEENSSPGTTHTATTQPGVCEQIDGFNGGAFVVGVCVCNPPEVSANQCNGSCSTDNDCAGNLVCSGGKCRNSKCTGQADCTCNTQTACGDGKLDAGEDCEVGIACASSAETCDESTCSCSTVQITNAKCGETCESTDDCSDTGTVCNDGVDADDSRYPSNTCILSTCTVASANCNASGCATVTTTNICGGSCQDNSDCTQSGTVCNNGTDVDDSRYPSNTCILTECTSSDATCSANGCTLPKTAIVEGRTNQIIVGLLTVLIGMFLIKFKVMQRIDNMIGITSEGKKGSTLKKRKRFENSFK